MPDPAEALGLRGEPADDYRGGPPRPWYRPRPGPAVRALTTAGALLVGFALTAGLSAARDIAQAQSARKESLIDLVGLRQARTRKLGAQLERLRERLERVQESAAGVPRLQRIVERLEVAAGLTALTGPGAVLTLSDAEEGSCTAANTELCRIQDADLQAAVNTLFAAGAEALAVNGQRVIATTAIRNAGAAVLVNYRILASPYVVEAVGDPDALAAGVKQSPFARDFADWTEVYGLGYGLEPTQELRLPAYTGSVRLRRAEVAGLGP
ncbi:MAG: DUF881 domain-containing protein [Actinobacteria bacterium]|nr:DUF881 domain-containing protein [Actinomycetota bacterium]